ncbi:MAG: histidine phosphatase family protein [Sedimentisphaerales bacterium]|nr:histidine phosphatase family protein [Sedimentisphaerales bacterium]
MKTLLLLRHAKSSWDDPVLSDYQRPLNVRGKRDAPRMGRLIKEKNFAPDLILCSTSTRTRTTCELAVAAAELACPVSLLDDLYHASSKAIITVLNKHADSQPCILVVAHNPGLEELLCVLTGEWKKLPTAALAHLRLQIDSWKDFTLRSDAQLINIYRPKELA